MPTPFNNRLRKQIEALRSQKKKEEKEEKNKEKIPVNGEDPETKEDTITSVNYHITDNPDLKQKKSSTRFQKIGINLKKKQKTELVLMDRISLLVGNSQ